MSMVPVYSILLAMATLDVSSPPAAAPGESPQTPVILEETGQAFRKAGEEVKEGGIAVGQAAKKAGLAVGHGAKEAGLAVGHGAKKAG